MITCKGHRVFVAMAAAAGLLVMGACDGEGTDEFGNLAAAVEVDPQPDKMVICHVPGGDPTKARTLRIAKAAVDAHLRLHQGDAVGPCAADQPPTCEPDSALVQNLDDAELDDALADETAAEIEGAAADGEATAEEAKQRGASAGKAQGRAHFAARGVEKVAICHLPPGNPGNARTIVVGAPAVPAHLAQGSYLGPCSWACDADDAVDEIPEVGDENGDNEDDDVVEDDDVISDVAGDDGDNDNSSDLGAYLM